MTTSGVYSIAVNRDQIITQAMKFIRKLDELEVPTPTDISDITIWLNMLVSQWSGKGDFAPGLKTWTRAHGHLFLSSLTGQYALGAGTTGWTNSYVSTTLTASVAVGGNVLPLTAVTSLTTSAPNTVTSGSISAGDSIGVVVAGVNGPNLYWDTVKSVIGLNVTINGTLPYAASAGALVWDYTATAQQPDVIETAYLRDQWNEDTPLKILNQQSYDFLPSKGDITSQSDPTAIYYEFQLGNGVLNTDVAAAQDVTKHICMSYMTLPQGFVNPADTPYYPQEWYLPLVSNLGRLIAPLYGKTWTAEMEHIATVSLAVAQQKEPDTSVLYFQCNEEA